MVVRFLIDPDALDSDVIDQARSHADHNRLFCEWKRYGVMIMPTDFSTVKTKIEKMPVEQRKQWQIALKDDRFRKAEWNDNSAEHVLADVAAIKSTKDAFDLVCLENTKVFCFGIPESNISAFLKDDIEICRYDCTDQSASFKKQRDIWNSLVLTGDSVEEVWKKRFLGLTRFGRKISIVDRYSLKNTLENFSNGIFSDLESMLKLVSSAGGPKKKIINMYASDCKTKDFCIEKVRALEIMEKICRTYYGKIASFHLHLAPDAVFQTVAHDRFIRFDGVVTSIGKGISLFRNGNNIDNYACSLMTDDRDEFRTEIEGKLRRSAEYFTIL